VLTLGILDGLWAAWDKQNRTLHDMLAGTRVARIERAPVISAEQLDDPVELQDGITRRALRQGI
jgi:hypothetical protein